MRPKRFNYALAALDRNGICAAQTPAGAGNLTINGALASGGAYTADAARHIAIYAAGDESGRTFTLTGTNRYGSAMTESITGPNATTVIGSKNFATISSIAVDAGTSGDVEVGTYSTAETGWVSVDRDGLYNIEILKTTIVCDVVTQYTLDDIWGSSFDESTANAYTMTNYDLPVVAIRFKITALSTGGTLTFKIMSTPLRS